MPCIRRIPSWNIGLETCHPGWYLLDAFVEQLREATVSFVCQHGLVPLSPLEFAWNFIFRGFTKVRRFIPVMAKIRRTSHEDVRQCMIISSRDWSWWDGPCFLWCTDWGRRKSLWCDHNVSTNYTPSLTV